MKIPRQLSTFRSRLIVLVMLAILPAVGLIVYASIEDRSNARDDAESDMLELGDLVNQSVTGTVARATTLLATLAALQDIQAGNERDCAATLGGLPPEVRGEYVDLYVAAPDGAVRCAAERVGPTNVADVDAVKAAVERKEPILGDYHADSVTGKAVASLAYPVLNASGDVTGVVGLSFDLGFINQVSTISNLPLGSTLLVIDRNGAILVRLPDGAEAIGSTVADKEILAAVRAQGPRGTLRTSGLDGTSRLYGFVPLLVEQPTRPYVVVGLPTASVYAQSDDALERNVIGLLIAVPLAVAAAWLFGEVLLGRRLKGLSIGTQAVATGDLSVRVDEGGNDEISGLARSFNEMTAELALSRRQTVETEAQFRAVFESAQDGLVINDPESRTVVEANPAFCRMHGYEPGTMAGVDPLSFIQPQDHDKFGAYIAAGRAGEVFRTRATDIRLDGSTFPIDVTGTIFQFRGRRHLLAVCRDVTEQVQTEQLLEDRVTERTRQLSTLLEVARSVGSTLELRPLISLILQQLKQVVDYRGASVVTFDDDAAALTILEARFAGSRGLTVDNRATGMHIPFARGNAIWRELGAGRAAIIPDIRDPDHEFATVYRETVGDHMDAEFQYIRCWMGVPLIIKDHAIGMLTISRSEAGALDGRHAELAVAFASQVAAALENARLFEQTNRRAIETATLAEIAASFTLAGDLQKTLETIAGQVIAATDAVACDLTLITADREVGISGAQGLPDGWTERAREITAAGAPSPILAAARSGKTSTYSGLHGALHASDAWAAFATLHTGAAWDTIVVTPLIYRGNVVGTLDTFYLPDEAPAEEAAAFLQAIADQVAVGIENARLFESTQRKARENAALAAIAADVTIDQPVEVTLGRIAEHVVSAINGSLCGIYLYVPQTNSFSAAGIYGVPEHMRAAVTRLAVEPGSVRLQALAEGKVKVIPDLRERLREHAHFQEFRDEVDSVAWRTAVDVPMTYRGEPVGVLVVSYPTVFEPSAEDLSLLNAIGDEVAIAISNVRLFEQTERKARENAALAAIAADVTIDQPVGTTINRIAQHVIDGVGPDSCGIYLYDADDKEFSIAGSAGMPAELIDTVLSVPAQASSVRLRALETGKSVVISDLRERVAAHAHFEGVAAELEALGIESTVDVPLFYRGDPVGVLVAGYRRRFEPNAEELGLLEAVGDEVAIAISNVKLFERTERRAKENAALANIAANITLAQPMQETLDGIAAGVLEATTAVGCAVMFVEGGEDGEAFTLRTGGGVGMPDGFMDVVNRLPNAAQPFSPRALRTGSVTFVTGLRDRFASDPAYAELVPFVEAAGWGTGAVVPVIYRGRPVGVLNVAYRIGADPGAEERQTLAAIADQAAIAIENVRLFNETGRKARANAALASIAANFTVGQPMREALDAVARNAVAAVPRALAAGVVLVDVETNRITLSGGSGLPQGMIEAMAQSVPATDTFSVDAIEQGTPLLIENARTRMLKNPTFFDVHKGLVDVEWENIVIVPILFRSRPLGAINVGFAAGDSPDDDEYATLRAIADQAAIAVENVRLYEQTDRRARENAALARVAANATLEQPFRRTLDGIASSVTAATRAVSCAVSIVEEDASAIEMVGGSGLPPGFVEAAASLSVSLTTIDPDAIREHGGRPITNPRARQQLLTDPAFAPLREFHPLVAFNAMTLVPILYRGRSLGALNVGYQGETGATADEEEILRAIADQAAVAISNARLFEQAERRVTELEALRGIAQNITLVRPIESTLNSLARSVISATKAVACSLMLLDTNPLRVRLAAGHGLPAGYLDALQAALDNDSSGEKIRVVTESDNVVEIHNARERILAQAVYEPIHPFMSRIAWDDYWIMPLRYQGRTIGSLTAYFMAGDQPGEREVDFLSAIADQAAVAVENARLFSGSEQRAREQQALASIAAGLTYDRPIQEFLNELAEDVVRSTRGVACMVVVSPESGGARWFGESGLPPGYLDAVAARLERTGQTDEERRVTTGGEITVLKGLRDAMRTNPELEYVRQFADAVTWDAAVRVALSYRGRPLGGLMLYFTEGQEPDADERRFLRAIADQAAVAIENAQLYTDADLRAREQFAIASVAARLTYDRPLGEVLEAIAGDVVQGTRALACSVIVMAGGQVYGGEYGLPEGYMDAVGRARSDAPEFWDRYGAFTEVDITEDARNVLAANPAYAAYRPFLEKVEWDTVVRVPFTHRDGARGLVILYLEGGRPDEAESRFYRAIADQASGAIENARLYSQADLRAREQEAIASIAARLTYDRPVGEVLDAIAGDVVRGTRALACAAFVMDEHAVTIGEFGLPAGYLQAVIPRNPVEFQEVLGGEGNVTLSARAAIAERDDLADARPFLDQIAWDVIVRMPLTYHGQTRGALNVYLPPGPEPSVDELRLFRAIADQSSAAVENARLFSESERQAREQAALASIAASLTYDRPLAEVLDGLATNVVRGTRALACSVLVLKDGQPSAAGQHGLPVDYLRMNLQRMREFGLRPEETAVYAGQANVSNNTRREIATRDDLAVLRQFLDEVEWDIVARVPLMYDGEPRGAMLVYLPPGPNPGEDEMRFYQAIADQASIAMENARLFTESEQHALEQAALASIAASLTYDRPLAEVLEGLATNVVRGTRALACTVMTLEGGQPSQAGQHGLPDDYLRMNRRRIRQFGISQAEAAVYAGQPNITNNMQREIATREDLEPLRQFLGEIAWDIIARVPVTYDGEPRGALMVYLPPGPDPGDDEMRYYQAIADQASVAMENARLFTESEQHAREQEAIASIAASLTYDRPLADVLAALAGDVVRGSRASACSVIVMDRNSQELTWGNAGLPEGYMEAQQQAWADAPDYWGGHAFRSGTGIVPNARETMRTHPAYAAMREFADLIDWDTVVRIPFLAREKVMGWLVLYLRGGRPDERELLLFRALTDQASVAVENARLFNDVENRTKQLTALYRADQELHRSLRLDDVLRALASVVADTLAADSAGMTIWPPDAPRPRLLAAGNISPKVVAAIEDGVASDGREYWDQPDSPDRVEALEDTRLSDEFVRRRTADLGLNALIEVPVFVGGRRFGALAAAYFDTHRFSEDEKQLLKALAGRAALAIENAQLYEQSEDRARQLAALYRADEELHRSLRLDDVLHALMEVTADTLEASNVALVIWEPGAARPRLLTARPHDVPGVLEFVEESITKQGSLGLSPDFDENPRVVEDTSELPPQARARTADIGVASLMEVPVLVGGELFGILDVVYSERRNFSDDETRLLTSLARRASLAIENAQLYEQAQSLAAVEERQRLARELHDSVSQALYGIALGSRTARTLLDRDPSRAIEPVEYVLSLAEAGLAEMRALIFELRPESLATEGLVAAIDKQVASTRARYNIDVDATLPAEEPDIPLPLKEAVYRVGQEALHNIVKHARATHVDVLLAYDGQALLFDLRDNGQGFDPSGDFPGHLGLRSMRERIERAGGGLLIESAPGEGTHLRATVPIPE